MKYLNEELFVFYTKELYHNVKIRDYNNEVLPFKGKCIKCEVKDHGKLLFLNIHNEDLSISVVTCNGTWLEYRVESILSEVNKYTPYIFVIV